MRQLRTAVLLYVAPPGRAQPQCIHVSILKMINASTSEQAICDDVLLGGDGAGVVGIW